MLVTSQFTRATFLRILTHFGAYLREDTYRPDKRPTGIKTRLNQTFGIGTNGIYSIFR